jgi:nicotinamidase/pyrazinamidase
MAQTLSSRDALLVIDMQHDFLPGGALGVTEGDTIVANIEALAKTFEHVVLTQDWHPVGHISFASSHEGKQAFVDTVEAPYGAQTLWPEHCLQGSRGAELAVDISHAELILRKGYRREIDSYSAFLENDHMTPTGLAGYLRERQIDRLFFCGLAYDFCVGFSAIDGYKLGFECFVVEDLARAVALPGSVDRTNQLFAEAGIRRIHSADIAAH